MKKKVIRVTVFFLILTILFCSTAEILQAKWIGEAFTNPTLVYEDMKKLQENEVELLVIGTSTMVHGFSSMYMEETYGIPTYSCATGSQPMLCSLYNLKEMDRHHNISTVLFDMSKLFGEDSEVRFRQTLDSVVRDKIWLETLIEHQKSGKAEPFWSYIFPIVKYHSRWSQLKKVDYTWKNTKNNCFRGNTMVGHVEAVPYHKLCIDEKEADEEQVMAETSLAYFRQMAEYCKKRGINLVLVKTPTTNWDKVRMQLTQSLAKEYGLDYLDFNTEKMIQELQINVEHDFKDNHHLNIRGAEKLTDYLAEYLLERYGFSDIRLGDSYDKEEVQLFLDSREEMYLTTSCEVAEMAEYLKNEKYEIYAMEDAGFEVSGTESVGKLLEDCGAVYDDSVFQDKKFNNKGLHLLVMERETGKEVDVSTIYCEGEELKIRHKNL